MFVPKLRKEGEVRERASERERGGERTARINEFPHAFCHKQAV